MLSCGRRAVVTNMLSSQGAWVNEKARRHIRTAGGGEQTLCR